VPRHSAPQQPAWLRPRLVVAFVVAAAGLVTAVWLPTRNDSADAAERNRNSRERARSLPAFADDFGGRRGSTIDPAKWALRTDRVDDNLRFSESVRNARLDGDGNLVIVLRGEDNNSLSTARLYSRGTLRGTAGHVEARIKVPGGEGLRPAFELVDAERPGSGALNVLAEPVTDDDFHTYAVDWKPGEVVLSVDGKPIERDARDLDTDRPFRLALTLGVGDDRERVDVPARMVVDSVSFSGADASADPTAPPATTPPATTPPATEPPAGEPPATEPPTTAPTTIPPTATTPPTTPPAEKPAAAAWKPFTDYVAGQLVTFKSVEYQVQETHTSLPGWEPTALPALFKKI
jgi:hypothetical protein